MLSIMFGQSKYYVDNLSENAKRGLRAKVRNGDFPSIAPFGYLNDTRIKTIVLDKRYSPLVRQMFKIYARGDKTMTLSYRMKKLNIFEVSLVLNTGKFQTEDILRDLRFLSYQK